MVSSLAWTRAAALLGLPRAASWPAMLEPLQAAKLQTGFATDIERRKACEIADTLGDACMAGEIVCEAAQRTVRPKQRRIRGYIGGAPAGAPVHAVPAARIEQTHRIGAAAFVAWLRTQGDDPAALVQAWASAAQSSQVEEVSDPQRRLALLRELGGGVKWFDGKWEVTGMRALVQCEKGRPRSSEKTIRADLHDAAEAERREGKGAQHTPAWHP